MSPEWLVIVWYDGLGSGTGEVLRDCKTKLDAIRLATEVMLDEEGCHAEVYHREA